MADDPKTISPKESKPMTAKPKSSAELLGWLWTNYLRQRMGLLSIAVVFMVIEGSMVGALSYMMQPMFDEIFVKGNSSALGWVSAVFFLIFAVRGISGVVQKVTLTRISLITTAHIKTDLLNHLIRQDTAFHQTHPPGLLMQRVNGDVGAVAQVWRAIITGAGKDVVSLVVLLGVAINVDLIWTLLMMVGIPLVLLPIAGAQKYVRKKAAIARDVGAALSTRLNEIFHGIVPIKLNTLETYQIDRFTSAQRNFVRTETRAALGTASITGLIDIMAGLGFMGVLLYGGAEIIAGDKSVGQFMSFFTAIGLAFDPMRRLASTSGTWQIAAASLERVKELIDMPIELRSPASPVKAPTTLPDILLSDVTLSYGDADVLRGLSFSAEAGKTTALIGASGAGKSTVFNLLTRLVDPKSGTAAIGGVGVSSMALGELRKMFSVVTQDALLFDESLRENILLGRTDVSNDELTAVLDAAHVSDFLPRLGDGLDTLVGPRGSALSGGQRQRVVIARALLRNTPILLLDEATSALDAQSEQVVQAALDKLSAGRTTIVIAHRLSTVRNADKIVVMDRGRAVDEGTHDELLARGGLYADLYRLQFKDGLTVVDPKGVAAQSPSTPGSETPHRTWLRKTLSLFGMRS